MRTPADDLKQLFTALYNPNEGERSNAASLLYRRLLHFGVHPSDIELTIGESLIDRQKQVIDHLKNEADKILRELNFLLRHTDKVLLAKAHKASEIEDRWPELEALIRTRFLGIGEFDELPRGWQAEIIRFFEIPPLVLRRWVDGTEQIPRNFIEAVRDLPLAAPRRRRGRAKARWAVSEFQMPQREAPTELSPAALVKTRKQAVLPFYWTEERFYRLVKAWKSGSSNEEIMRRVGCETVNQVAQCIYSGPPKFQLKYDDTYPDEISWEEAWTIGGYLYRSLKAGQNWKSKILADLGKDVGLLPPDPIGNVSPGLLRLVRQRYKDYLVGEQLDSTKGQANELLDLIRKAGKGGATLREVGERVGWNSKRRKDMSARAPELQRQLQIFRGPARGRKTVFVAAEFKDSYPAHWEAAFAVHGKRAEVAD